MRKQYGSILLRGGVGFVFASSLAFASAAATPATAWADQSQASSYQGVLKNAVKAVKDKDLDYVAYVTFNDNVTAKITFLEPGIFRYNVDLSGDFGNYATPRSKSHTAKIQAQPDASGSYSHPGATVNETSSAVEVSDGTVTISFDKATAKMSVRNKAGETVFEEQSALNITSGSTTQAIAKDSGENYYGGGTQNGRFVHTGKSIHIANESGWEDGGVSSPNPFYWSSDGYGVLRNTFADGTYDFGAASADTVSATHNDGELDAYYFVADAATGKSTAPVAQSMLQDYYKVTGNPILMPEYGFYLGHYNAYNRDMWSKEAQAGYTKWTVKGHQSATGDAADSVTYEKGGTGTAMQAGTLVESLNGHGPTVSTENIPEGVSFSRDFSAQAKLDQYQEYDMPLGYFLVNDGYGAGYGQNGYNKTGGVKEDGTSDEERQAALDANLDNLGEFADYAQSKGVATGLWTQSDLTPSTNADTKWQLLRDMQGEAEHGVSTLKTDVAWVGYGYSFQLNGVKYAYDTVTQAAGVRPNIVSLDGWAGSQRYAGNWTGDQYGGKWEYIRFHVPTFIGQGLSGNPNIGSDMDGIFGGHPLIATRDYQWKTFAPIMMDMDGWGSYAKMPYTYGDPYTGINRMYLKLKSSLLPYIYTTAASAANIDTGNGDAGLPIVRAIALSDDSAYAASTATQYEYTMGEDFLVAPIYQNTDGDSANNGLGDGNDVRDGIYLPGDSNTTWIDYWTGKQYRGGQVLNNYDAPLWKLPVFVKANAIIPMWAPNDNPTDIDRTHPETQFFATSGENSYTSYEDDGTYIENKVDESDSEYGAQTNISYGDHVSRTFTSKVEGGTATFTAEAAKGTYEGYDSNRTSTFTVNVSKEPSKLTAKNGEGALKEKKVSSQEEFEKTEPAAGEVVTFYNARPNLNSNAFSDSEAVRDEAFSKTEIVSNPKLYVKFAKTDVSKTAQTLTLEGFENEGGLPVDHQIEGMVPTNLAAPEDGKTPTSITLTWDAVEGATGYEVMADGVVNVVGDKTTFKHTDLAYSSSHEYKVRALTSEGHSAWSEALSTKSLDDPWRNVPTPEKTSWQGGYYNNQKESLAIDHNTGGNHFHSDGGAIGKSLTFDYGKAYHFEKLEYYPRSDFGNGTVQEMKLETSMDGLHWLDQGTQTFDWSSKPDFATAAFKEGTVARYVRMTPTKSVGNFFSARELAVYKKDGSKGFAVGSLAENAEVSDGDYTAMHDNAAGLRESDNQWQGHVANHGGDLNMNGVYDVYEMAYTMSRLDGGTKKTDKVSGEVALIPSKSTVTAGETIDVDLHVSGASGVNAYGSEVTFDPEMFELVGGSVKQSPYTASMENLSNNERGHADAVHLAFANRGDKDLYEGTGVVATFKLKAKKDGDVKLASTSWLIGPAGDSVETVSDGTVTLPDAPAATPAEYGQDAFDITVTNDALTTDDGTNVSKLIQGGKFDPLFDDVKYHDNGSGSGCMELKWNVAEGDPTVHTPLSLHFAFKTPSALDDVTVTNRVDKNGTLRDRGSIRQLSGTITFEDGTTQEFSGGDLDSAQAAYKLAVSEENAGKLVKSVDVNVLKSSATNLLTISEIDFNYTVPGAKAESIELSADNAASAHEGTLVPVGATVKCAGDVDYPYFTVESSDPSIASAVAVQSGDEVLHYLRANKPGTVKVKVASALDPSVFAEYEFTVEEGVDTSALDAALAEARTLSASAYTEDSFAKLTEALTAAEELLKGGAYTDDDVARAVVAIRDAVDGLKMRALDEAALINRDASSGVSVAAVSSYAAESPMADALDYDEDTIWHSNYNGNYSLPQHIVFDLGAEYDLTDVTFLPRQSGSLNGDIFEAELYVGDSVEELEAGTAQKVGTFKFANNGRILNNRDKYQQMAFGATTGRYVMLKATRSGSSDGAGNQYCSIAETRFYGKRHEEETKVNKAALSALVKKCEGEALKAEDYTEDTWKAYELALKDAQDALASGDVTQDEVNGYVDALKAAREGLKKAEVPPVTDPTREQLERALDTAKKLDTTGKPAENVARLDAAIKNAEGVLDREDATAAEISAAYDQLREAVERLDDAVPADKSALQTLVESYEGMNLDSSKYTEASWSAYADALAKAKEVLADDSATQDAVSDAATALNDAFAGLELAGGGEASVDKSGLEGLIAKHDGLALDSSKYTAKSWGAYADALSAAKEVMAREDATQSEVDAAIAALNRAYAGLEKADAGNQGGGQTGKPGQAGGKRDGKLVKTGDGSLIAAIATGVSGLFAAGAGIFTARRKRK